MPLLRTDDNHQPLPEAAVLQAALEDLFKEYDVDLYLCGHVHAYERQWPVYKNQVLAKTYAPPESTVYIVDGAGGCPEGLTDYDPKVRTKHEVAVLFPFTGIYPCLATAFGRLERCYQQQGSGLWGPEYRQRLRIELEISYKHRRYSV
jgi:hypothetical protein